MRKSLTSGNLPVYGFSVSMMWGFVLMFIVCWLQVADTDVGWTLGYMLNLTNMIPSERTRAVTGVPHSQWAALIFFIVFALFLSLLIIVTLSVCDLSHWVVCHVCIREYLLLIFHTTEMTIDKQLFWLLFEIWFEMRPHKQGNNLCILTLWWQNEKGCPLFFHHSIQFLAKCSFLWVI